ncbi:hypothetical protein CsSME_00051648 [Camellia sinensis var. sinensis]
MSNIVESDSTLRGGLSNFDDPSTLASNLQIPSALFGRSGVL